MNTKKLGETIDRVEAGVRGAVRVMKGTFVETESLRLGRRAPVHPGRHRGRAGPPDSRRSR